MLDHLRWGVVVSLAICVSTLAGLLSTVRLEDVPRYGHRGAERLRVKRAGGVFSTCEPVVRFVGALIAALPLQTLRKRQEIELTRADDVLGINPDELSALSVLSAILLGISVLAIASAIGASVTYGIVAAAFGLLLPTLQVREVIRQRAKLVTRALPPAIEIAAMTMGAGLDFPGALRMLTEPGSLTPSPLAREFRVILEHIEFGHTRKEALEGFAERVPSRAVIDFVAAVVQAEQKGNPLACVLQIQGRMLNMRRSVAAEEAAARAGVLLIVPMVFLLGAILLLLMGPFLVKGIGW